MTKVNFLDVTLDLQSGKHYPYTKEGNIPLYVHKKSNHPPSILKNIPESINKRLSEISSDKESFEKAKGTYQDALNKSGYNYNLTYRKPSPDTKHRKNRPRNITWFNPPYSQNVKTKVGKCFLTLIDKHFPKSNPLHKILNRNTLKLSYSCMNNVKAIISNHNKAVISRSSNLPVQTINTCNCRDKRSCPMDGNCNERNIIYQAEVTTSHSKQTYIGLCDTSFKSRYRNHTCSFRNERYRNSTELSKYVWGLKDKKTDYQIRWRSIRHARSYSNVTKKCNLCLSEKYYIICRPNMATLNNRNELVSSCRHAKKFLLNNVII